MSDHSVPSPTTTTTRNRIGSFLTLSSSSSPTPSSSTSVANNNNNNNNKRRSIFRRLIPKSKPESECEQESSSPQQRTTRSMSNMSSSSSSSNSSGNGEESSLSIVDRLTTKELNQLKEQFKNIDSNCKKNGKISIEEFAKCFGQVVMTTTNATNATTSSVDSPDGSNNNNSNNSNNKYSFVQLLFSMFDMDNSGYIDYQEFLLAMTIVIKGDSIDKSKFAFKMLDMNNDGYIEREELRCLVNQMYHFVCDTLCVDPMPFIHHHQHYDDSSFLSSAQDNVNNDSHELLIDAYADAMFEKMDVSRSGRITLQQLQQFMLPITESTAVMSLNNTHTDPYCDTSTLHSDDEEEDGAEEEEEEDSSNSVVDCDASNTTNITNNSSSSSNNNNSNNGSSGHISSGKHKKKQSGMIPIGFGSSKWKFVLQLQMAIQIACQFTQYRPMVHYIDFSSQIQFQLPLELPTSSTSLHNYNDTRSESNSSLFIEYAPLVFRHIRQMCQVNETEYMDCMGMERVLSNILLGNLSSSFTEKISDGKSGSFFFYSHNEQFMIKTIPTSEFDVLMRILPQYYHHLKTYGTHKTLLMKILACYRFQNQYCIVLANMLPLDEPLSSVYDLKGSSIGRSNPNGFVKKDNDFPQFQKHLWVTNQNKDEVMEQIRVDVAFLQEHQLLDYSLLVGICDHHSNTVEDIDPSEQQQWNTATTRRIVSSDGKQVYYIGIIDLLTEFNDRKKLEFVGKSIVHSMNASKLSVQHPKVYGQRFIEFMEEKVFMPQ